MKRKLFLVSFLLLSSVPAFSQGYEIATWYGFRNAAVNYTFDDGNTNQFDIAIPMFNKYGFKLTMFTVINWSGNNWDKLDQAAEQGHEIASHTITHGHMPQMADSVQEKELKDSQDIINEKVKGQKCLTFAYPYCEEANPSLTGKYYFAARGCSGAIENSSPTDFMNISSILSGKLGPVKTASDFNKAADSTAQMKGWVIYLLHGIDDDGGYSPVTSKDLEESLKYLKSNEKEFWVTSFVNAALYVKERNNASVKEKSANGKKIIITLTDNLENSIYNHPLSISRQLPVKWKSASVKQAGQKVRSEVVTKDGKRYLLFESIPDGGDIIISKK